MTSCRKKQYKNYEYLVLEFDMNMFVYIVTNLSPSSISLLSNIGCVNNSLISQNLSYQLSKAYVIQLEEKCT